MREVLKRFRTGGRRRWVLAAFGAAAAIWVVFQLLPSRARGVSLELMALGADGRFADDVAIPNHWADTTGAGGAILRVPLILAVRNSGRESAPPTRLELSLPARYRISRSDGRPLQAEYVAGTPMVRYWLDVPATKAVTGAVAGYLPVLDTVWLEPIIPSFYCITLADSVPDFVPSPPAPVEAISRVRIFYSFTGEELGQRQTGLLAVSLDPDLLEQEVPPPPPVFPTHYGEAGLPRPALSGLNYVGSRHALCGDPQDPIEILSTLWETPEGGRLFVLDYGGAPRKYLYDLNRDSIIELEAWDASGTGKFDARRQARLPIPAFLMPPQAPPQYDPSIFASLPPEELLALDRYSQVLEAPYRFRTRTPPSKPNLNRYRPGTIGSEGRDGESRRGMTITYWTDPGAGATPPGGATAGGAPAGGERQVQRGQPHPPSGATPPTEAPSTPTSPPVTEGPPTLGRPLDRPDRRPTQPPVTPPATPPVTPPARQDPRQERPGERPDPTPPAQKPKPDESGPKLLGKPLDSIPRRPPPDTTGRRP